jgi:hypothetical protein
MALGALPSTIGKMIVSRGVGLTGIGVGIGLILSGIMAPMISTVLYGVRPLDPEVFLGVPLILMVVAYWPATFRRAVRQTSTRLSHCERVETAGFRTFYY